MWKRARGEMLLGEIKVPESTPLSKEQPLCFCATLSGRGTQSKRSNHLEEFFPLIRKASLTWVDIKVDDFEKDAVETSTKMGFSELLVTQLLTRLADRGRFQGGYEDFDTEMGLLFPEISMEGGIGLLWKRVAHGYAAGDEFCIFTAALEYLRVQRIEGGQHREIGVIVLVAVHAKVIPCKNHVFHVCSRNGL